MSSSHGTDLDEQATDALRARLSGLRVALVHDWLTGHRGGEKVLAAIAGLVPQADLFTLIHVAGTTHPALERHRIEASWMNRLPMVRRYYRWLLPLFPAWADHLDLQAYDLVLSTSHCVAKGVRARSDALHLCYCHTPMRYVWDRFDDYFGHLRGPKGWLIGRAAERLRAWDRATARRPDRYLANSRFVRQRILEFYDLDENRVEVLHPPVELEQFPAPPEPPSRGDRYLVVSALVAYKRIDVAVEAVARSGRGLDVIGTGPQARQLEDLADRCGAGDRIRFVGFVDDHALGDRMRRARALLFPGVEDFGITVIEATACGLPVIALGRGGALDTVEPGVNGVLYEDPSVDGLIEALDRFEEEALAFDPFAMRQRAEAFGRERFEAEYLQRLGALLS